MLIFSVRDLWARGVNLSMVSGRIVHPESCDDEVPDACGRDGVVDQGRHAVGLADTCRQSATAAVPLRWTPNPRRPDGHASEDSRKEVMAYLSPYRLHGITILHPGVGAETSTVTDGGRSIEEVPVAPPADKPRCWRLTSTLPSS